MPYCQSCGQEVAADARWCRNCGQPVSGGSAVTPGGYQVAAAGGVPRTPGNATASLVLGLVGLVVCPVVCSVLALVFGYQARRVIRTDPNLQGEGMATAGIVLGWVGITLGVLLFLVLVSRAGRS